MNWRSLLSRFGPYFGLIFVLLIFAVFMPSEQFGRFVAFYNLKTILTQTVIVGIAAFGMTLVIISGGIDLSTGSQIALGTVVAALVLKVGGVAEDPGLGLTLGGALAAILACGLCGLVSGVVIAKFKIVPFIVTLGAMQVVRGLAKWQANEQTVITPQNALQNLMRVDPEPAWLVFAPGVWLALLLLGLCVILLKYTVFGRYIFAIGSNEQTARLCGIPVERVKIMIYTVCGVFTGIASVMQYSDLAVGDPTTAAGKELDVIAAVVIGGASLSGGEGSAVGSIIGALIMAVLRNGCNMLGIPTYAQEIMIGLIIVGAVLVDRLKHRLA
ncbi:MAG: ABC transporter permease [Bernardetiaceae bacterium]|jgi:ribose transport system permease protein|nr:ABC transporter permease [Bernardetiaceae bacterium]